MMVQVSEQAPDFRLQTDAGEWVSLTDLVGKWVVLYFYPKDDTPGCTTEACAFRDALSEFQKRGVSIYGVSADSTQSHVKFRDKYQLSFPLLSDPDKGVIQAYGAWQERSMYGRKFMGIVRSTVIIDPKGRVAAVMEKVTPKDHAQELLAWFDQRNQPSVVTSPRN